MALSRSSSPTPSIPGTQLPDISVAASDEEIRSCFPVMKQLRPHLEIDDFVSRIRRQFVEGYELACLIDDGSVRSVAGYRLLSNLASGRVLYVDDLVSDSSDRSKGYGGQLFEWLIRRGRVEGCDTLELDSGVQRFEAHRFYLHHRMIISSHHFRLKLDSGF